MSEEIWFAFSKKINNELGTLLTLVKRAPLSQGGLGGLCLHAEQPPHRLGKGRALEGVVGLEKSGQLVALHKPAHERVRAVGIAFLAAEHATVRGEQLEFGQHCQAELRLRTRVRDRQAALQGAEGGADFGEGRGELEPLEP